MAKLTEGQREAFYDTEIAPVLADLSKRCLDNGLSFLAVVEWSPGETGRTLAISPPFGWGIEIANYAAQAGNNMDSLIFATMKKARETGHSSICLQQLGVPTAPAIRTEPQSHD